MSCSTEISAEIVMVIRTVVEYCRTQEKCSGMEGSIQKAASVLWSVRHLWAHFLFCEIPGYPIKGKKKKTPCNQIQVERKSRSEGKAKVPRALQAGSPYRHGKRADPVGFLFLMF